MRFKFRQQAEPYERFAPGCFDGVVERQTSIKLADNIHWPGRLIAAEIDSDGSSVEFTIELEDVNGCVVLPGKWPSVEALWSEL